MRTLKKVLFLTLLTGCAHFQDRPLEPHVSASRLQARSLNGGELRQFLDATHISKQAPWNLDTLTLAAWFYHPDMALIRAQAAMADAAGVTAAQRPNPSVAITPTWISNLADAMPWIFVSSVSIPIETAGKRGLRMDRSKHLDNAARLRIADTAWLVRGRLRLALLDTYAAQTSLGLLQQQQHLQERINQGLREQQQAGELANSDVLAAQLALAQVQVNVSAAEKKCADSQALLAAAIGIPVSGLAGISLDFSEFAQIPDVQKLPLKPLTATALRERPDVLAMLAEYAAAQAALQLEIANQYPNIQANPGYTWNTGENRWLMGLAALQLPIVNQNQGLIAEMAAKRQETAVRFEALQLRIIAEIDRAHAAVLAVRPRVETTAQLLRNRQSNVAYTQALVIAGEADAHALAIAELEQSLAERSRLDVLVESQQAIAQLEAALRYPVTGAAANRFMSALASLPLS
ncbi:MAG: TolC family protein [Methylovulum sp.]|nr:TolC family protein [Methylovulum sp.]